MFAFGLPREERVGTLEEGPRHARGLLGRGRQRLGPKRGLPLQLRIGVGDRVAEARSRAAPARTDAGGPGGSRRARPRSRERRRRARGRAASRSSVAMRPARRSVSRPPGPAVAKLARAVTSPGATGTPSPIVSSTPATHLGRQRVVSEDREVAGAAARGDSGRDRDLASERPLGREPVEIRLPGALERGRRARQPMHPPRPSMTTRRIFESVRRASRGSSVGLTSWNMESRA